MEIKNMTVDELEARKAEIRNLVETEGADLDALEEEARAINTELEKRLAEEAKKNEIRKAVVKDETAKVVEKLTEDRTMPEVEVRNSKAYIDAYANYIKTGKDAECRALLTENAPNDGQLPVPELVYEIVKTSWDKIGILKRVKKAFIKGNLKIGVEIGADPAADHAEGAAAPTEEKLVIAIVELVPASIKKWITFSDEAMDLEGAAFLEYIYAELSYQIGKKAVKNLIAKIEACGTVSTNTPSTDLAVPVIETSSISLGLIAQAISKLSDAATDPVIMMNKQTWADFKAVQYGNEFNVDPFEGLPIEFTNDITAFNAATTGVTFVIVGDLAEGALVNLPNGEEITYKFDDKSLAEKDLIKIVGRMYAGIEVVAENAFVKIAIPSA